jgi:hypothetical protein
MMEGKLMKSHSKRGVGLVLLVSLLLSWGVFTSVATRAIEQPLPGQYSVAIEQNSIVSEPLSERGHVALLGSLPAVEGVAQLFIDQGVLTLVRTYPTPERYVAEAPVIYFPDGPPPDLALHLYEVTAEPTAVPDILQAIQEAADEGNIIAETEQLAWLSYLPQQFLVSGACSTIAQTMELVPGVFPQTILDWDDGTQCADNEQIWQFIIEDEERVMDKVTIINTFTDTLTAQPNHLLVGTSRDYIAGSPYGPFEPDAGPRQPQNQPFTGQGVQVVVYDNIPYPLAAGESIDTNFQGVSVTVSYPFSLPTDLPLGPRPLSGHGTFVSSAAIALAPDADFHLVAIMNETAIGAELSWYQAMAHVIDETRPLSQTFRGSVFNYSFSLEITPTLGLTPTAAMNQALAAVDAYNIVQAASTGNDSAFTSTALPMTWPAQHTATVGVTAVIWDDSGLSCYANQGEIAMWGGGVARGQGSCTPAAILAQCLNGNHPEYCVTGWDPNSATNYAYGLGTSYATPQVVGLAAQAIESQGNPPGDWPDPDLIRDYLHDLVIDNPDPGNLEIGVIGNPYANLTGHTLYLPLLIKG